jgi:hypothetical protein
MLYHSEGYNICELVLHECYVNNLHTTTCSGMLGHHTNIPCIEPIFTHIHTHTHTKTRSSPRNFVLPMALSMYPLLMGLFIRQISLVYHKCTFCRFHNSSVVLLERPELLMCLDGNKITCLTPSAL